MNLGNLKQMYKFYFVPKQLALLNHQHLEVGMFLTDLTFSCNTTQLNSFQVPTNQPNMEVQQKCTTQSQALNLLTI